MVNRYAVHSPRGIYYLCRRADHQHPIFSSAEDYGRFESGLQATLRAQRTRLLAYCWLPDALHLVVELGIASAAEFMRILAVSARRGRGAAGSRMPKGYRSTLVRSDFYLAPLICQIHYLPVRMGCTRDVGEYPHTSHSAYLGQRSPLPVCTRRVLAHLGCYGADKAAYAAAMAEAPLNSLGKLFTEGSGHAPAVVDSEELGYAKLTRLNSLPRSYRIETLDRLIARIADDQALSVQDICSESRQRDTVIARARITWLATLTNLATLTEIGLRLRRSTSALTRAVAHYSCVCPEFFSPDIVAEPGLWSRHATRVAARRTAAAQQH